MDISVEANNYAEGKATQALTDAIAKAYADGFAAGYKAREEKEQVERFIDPDGVEYVDLGLPSGTLWASKRLREKEDGQYLRIAYCKAKAYNLPTAEQVKELKTYCRGKWNLYGYGTLYITGPNGNSICLDTHNKSDDPTIFWIKQSEGSRYNAFKREWNVNTYSNDAYLPLVDEFTGYSHGVLPVKNKQDI